VEVSADHDRRTHAFLTPQQDEVLAAPGGAQGELGHRGEVDVVVEVHGHRHRVAEPVEKAGIVPTR